MNEVAHLGAGDDPVARVGVDELLVGGVAGEAVKVAGGGLGEEEPTAKVGGGGLGGLPALETAFREPL